MSPRPVVLLVKGSTQAAFVSSRESCVPVQFGFSAVDPFFGLATASFITGRIAFDPNAGRTLRS
jgi:hypothetical protein